MSAFTASLWISLISIVLLFAAMAVIWGMMALMAKIPDGATKVKEEEAGETEEAPAPVVAAQGASSKKRAAVLAVATALAFSRKQGKTALLLPTQTVSAWQSVLRANRVSQRNQVFTRK